MKTYSAKKVSRIVRRLYHDILQNKANGVSEESSVKKEIYQNTHLIRGCCLNILNVRKELSACPRSESGAPNIYDEIKNYCEISNFNITEEMVTDFFEKLSRRFDLSYDEISCLIPVMEYCHLSQLKNVLNNNKSVGSILRSLHTLYSYDSSLMFETLSKTEEVLKRDEIYSKMDDAAKNLYRSKIRLLAKKRKRSEREIAVDLLKETRTRSDGEKQHIGRYLLKERRNLLYFPVLCSLIALLSIVVYGYLQNVFMLSVSLIPIFISAKLLCDSIFSRAIQPESLPKIRITNKNCPSCLVTIVSMISDLQDAKALLHRLDVLAHRISIEQIRVGLLLDLPPSASEVTEEEREMFSFIENEISLRNESENRFFCAIRKRKWVEEKFQFEAYGRKQGAMIEFCDLITGDSDAFSLVLGKVNGAKYLITLDSDTEPTPEAVERLIGFMEHPNHTPVVVSDKNGVSYVANGYGAAAPRVEANPETSYRSAYSALLAGNSGTEFYKNPHFNLYQDLFSEGIFCGKGILRISLYKELIAKRFRNDPILSHDLPEGEILRCANLSDIVFFDEIPTTVLADEKRNHRWIRGDFQNGSFLFQKENKSNLFRFKIIHNIARALFPFCCFFLITSAVFMGTKSLFAGLFFVLFPFFLRIPSLVCWMYGSVRRYDPLRGFYDAFKESMLNVLLLPSRAYNGLDGAIRGISRQICGTKKLEWTTAANTSASGKEIGDYYYQLRWQLVGFAFLFFPKTTLIGALWLLGPVIARLVSLPYQTDKANQIELCEELKAMWQYYADLVNEKNHWLPPDNYQQEPLNVIAPRTSPTNIGFALLSVLGAFDLEFITENELYTRIENSLSVIESLPKWNGHLYNWYDIQTLKILSPKFVSTVDCGNYAVCLFVLEKGLRNQRNKRADLIANRIEALLAATDFSLLYDEKKKLFPIGYNAEEDRMSSSFYDLYASEARLTSFYAIMKHQIPLEHWVQLARPTGQSRQDLILYSWSGTMFEYFMPHIFLPSYRRTLSGESLKGIVNAQMRYANKKIPWGISESCYYTFDSLLNYQYRAFGIPAAAARKDLSFPFVISPYSTFLAYPWFPSLAEENKKRLPKGKYGYFEAVDYRLGSENPRVVQCYMAHHIGMSFLSGVNVLKDRIMQKRFMEGEGEAYSALLAEQIPSYSTSFFLRPSDGKAQWESSQIRIDKPDPEHPRVKLLSNGALTEIVTDSGSGWLRSNHIDLTKYGSDPYAPSGIFLFIRNKGTLFGATYAPLYQDYGYRMYFDRSGATCYGSFSDFETRMTVTMAPDAPVSVRELTIKNNQMTENTYEFFLCTEPTLCDQRAYSAHPEYKDLFLTAEFNPAIRTLSYCRKGEEEQWLSVTASEPFRFDVRRDSFRDYSDVFACKCDGVSPYPIFPVILLRGAINIRGRGTGSIRFYFSASSTKQESISHLRKIVSQNIETLQRRYGQFYDSLCQAADIRSSDRLIFERIAPQLLFRVNKTALEEKAGNTLPLQELWRFGISGDFPIFTVRIGNDGVWRALPFIKALFLMIHAGIPADLILLYREEEGYQMPKKTALDALISEVEDSVRAHVFALNIHTMDEYLFIQKCSRTFINLERGWKLHNPNRTFRPIRVEGTPVPAERYRLTLGRGGYGKNHSFIIPKQGKEPLRPWCLILANKKFGTVLTERSLGYTFAENASENRITPRIPGSGYQPSGERYYAVIRGKKYDLLRNASVEYYCNRAIYRINLFGCIITTEVFVPTHLSAKVINVSINTDCGFYPEIVFEPHIILGKEDLGTVTRFSEDNKIYYTNAFNGRYGNGHSVLFTLGGVVDGKALKFRPESKKSSASFVLGYGMGLNSARRLAEILSELGRIKKELKQVSNGSGPHFKIETPNKEFNEFCNGFLIQQILASRIYGRTGSQQPGGAYGFRDQLQDSLCLATLDSAYLKRQILRCCAHQFEAGDVLHWWHPRRNQRDDGIRTRFSDDPFWLVFACGEYFKITQDSSFFEKKVAYLTGEPLKASESDRYFTPQRSETKESVYHHALQALRFGMKIGQNGLIEIGAGDWNDGMNRVESGGETVWGSMFAVLCIESFLPLTESLGTREERKELEKFAESLRLALRKKAFSHGRYLRGFRGDSTPFGDEDSIDLIPQAFAQFCNLDKERTDSALALAYDRLWDEDLHLIKLLSPPYQPQNDGFPGSIADYPPGVRENGGQYTHAGVWFARALFRQGDTERAWEILSRINPVSRSKTLHDATSYAAEPYVLAGDVYSLSQREGFGGWTHYTGAAGWYLKTVVEDLLGIERKGRHVTIRPHIPKDWNGCCAELQIGTDLLRIRIEKGTEIGCYEDGLRIENVLLNGTEHEIGIIV